MIRGWLIGWLCMRRWWTWRWKKVALAWWRAWWWSVLVVIWVCVGIRLPGKPLTRAVSTDRIRVITFQCFEETHGALCVLRNLDVKKAVQMAVPCSEEGLLSVDERYKMTRCSQGDVQFDCIRIVSMSFVKVATVKWVRELFTACFQV